MDINISITNAFSYDQIKKEIAFNNLIIDTLSGISCNFKVIFNK